MWRRNGFTLAEIAVVVGILSLVFATALPHFIKMMMVGNEEATVEAMRAVLLSCESYQANTQSGYPVSLGQMVNARPPYLDARFNGAASRWGLKGYRWFYRGVPSSVTVSTAMGMGTYRTAGSLILTADPLVRGLTGRRAFYADQTGEIRYNTQGPAGPKDEVLEKAEK